MILKNAEGAPAKRALEKQHPSATRVSAAPAQLPRRVHPTDGQLELLAWLEAHPNWSKLGPTDQKRARVLAREAEGPDVLTRRSVPELSARHGWTRGRVQLTLKALRDHGIAYPDPTFEILADGKPHQVGSVYRVVRDGLYLPYSKRALTPAQKRGAKRAAKTRQKQLRGAQKRHLAHRPCA